MKTLLKHVIRISLKGHPTGATVDRYYMYERIKKCLATSDFPHSPKVLSISYSNYLASLVTDKATDVVEANYPDFDILNLSFDSNSFDFVVADQVLEHIGGDPQRAIQECHRVLKPGGIMIHTTCLLNEIHDPAGDYWRFTPDGLRLLCRPFSEIMQCEGWGNKLAFLAFRFYPVPLRRWHPIYRIAMRNDGESLISTWVVARK